MEVGHSPFMITMVTTGLHGCHGYRAQKKTKKNKHVCHDLFGLEMSSVKQSNLSL